MSRRSELEMFFLNPHSAIFLENCRFLIRVLVYQAQMKTLGSLGIIRSFKTVFSPQYFSEIRIWSVLLNVNPLDKWFEGFPTLSRSFTYPNFTWKRRRELVICPGQGIPGGFFECGKVSDEQEFALR
jgi:hypothetical protein